MNNVYTGFSNKSIGTVLDVVRSKPAATSPVTLTPMCIYGAKVVLTATDYDISNLGNQYFDIRDIARAGFATSANPIDVAYARTKPSNLHPSRIDFTYTSVSASGIPPLGSTASIDAASADLNNNWVDFTTNATASSAIQKCICGQPN